MGKLSQSRSNALWRVLKERGALLEEDVGYKRAFSCQDGESCGAGGHGTQWHQRAAGGPTCVRTAPATASGHGDPTTPGTGLSPPATASFNSPVLRVTPAPQGRKLRLRELKQPAQSPTAREGRDETQGPGCSVGQGCTSALPATNKESGVSASETGVRTQSLGCGLGEEPRRRPFVPPQVSRLSPGRKESQRRRLGSGLNDVSWGRQSSIGFLGNSVPSSEKERR